MKHFISIADTTREDLRHALDIAKRLKSRHKLTGRNDPILAGKTLAMIFEKPSLRTRVSFSAAMHHLGGLALMLRNEEVGLGVRESVQDVARVLAGMCDGIMARTFGHEKVEKLAKFSSVPVINGLTDLRHPCQAMAALMTIEEHFGNVEGKTIAFIGDGNNVARSLALACGKFDMRFILASPQPYQLPSEDIDAIMAATPQLDLVTTDDVRDAVRDADVLYTDTWVSMGQEAEKSKRIADFAGFCIDENLLKLAPEHAIVLHCLPAYRGLEISEAVMEGPQSLVFAEAENRLHFQKGLLAVLMGNQ